MAKKKPSTESKAFKAFENAFGKLAAKLPDNVTIDATQLMQMALAGGSVYLIADDVAKWLFTANLVLQKASPDDVGEFDWELLLTQPGGLWRSMFDMFYGYDIADPSQYQFTPEEIAELEKKITEFKMDDEHRLALAMAVAAMTPQAAQLLAGAGKVIDGLVPF